jgi:hypothetical protein
MAGLDVSSNKFVLTLVGLKGLATTFFLQWRYVLPTVVMKEKRKKTNLEESDMSTR